MEDYFVKEKYTYSKIRANSADEAKERVKRYRGKKRLSAKVYTVDEFISIKEAEMLEMGYNEEDINEEKEFLKHCEPYNINDFK